MKRKMRKNYTLKLIVAFWLVCLLVLLFYFSPAAVVDRVTQRYYAAADNAEASWMPDAGISLNSSEAILVRLSDRSILYKYNENERTYPASLTKIMTALAAIESLGDLDARLTLEDSIFPALYQENASMAGFQPGETVRAMDLLYGAMLPSGAEAAITVARAVSGSEAEFAKKMNEYAERLGMRGTHFVNATGLHDEAHYTTVKDMAILLSYALKNDTFRQVFTSASYLSTPTDVHPDGLNLRSTLFDKIGSPAFEGGEIIGGKTGYTSAAGQCLASLAVSGGEEYILITTGARRDESGTQYNMLDAIAVYGQLAA